MTGLALAGVPLRLSDDPTPPLADLALRLESNLFTRVGASVRINRSEPLIFVIDTGAGQTAIADDLLPSLGLTPEKTVRVHGVTSTELAPAVTIDTLNLAGRRVRNLSCPVLPRRWVGADGLLGLDVLSDFRLALDMQGRRATLSSGRSLEITSGVTRLVRDRATLSQGPFGRMLISRTEVGGVRTTAFIDSGAQYSVANEELRRRLASGGRPDRFQPAGRFTLHGVTGQSIAAELGLVADLQLAGRRLGPTPLFFADLHCFSVMRLSDSPTLLIGADLLGRFGEVLIDFPRQTVAFGGVRRARMFSLAI